MPVIKWLLFVFVGSICFSLYANSSVLVDNARARATFSFAKTGAVYLTLFNKGNVARTLLSVSVPDTLADEAQIHTTFMSGDMMQMRELPAGVSIASKDKAVLQPGGMHIMLVGLKKPLKAGEAFTLSLHFAEGQLLNVVVPVVDMTL